MESANVRQIIKEFFSKSLQIILEARCGCGCSGSSCRKESSTEASTSSGNRRAKWFNLALGDCPKVIQNVNAWKQTDLDNLVVDVVLVHKAFNHQMEKILERWTVRYESDTSSLPFGRDSHAKGNKVYKSLVSMIRSLYAMTRFLPTYNIYQHLKSSRNKCLFKLSPKISSFVMPFALSESVQMSQFEFMPVDTHYGRLYLSVSYLQRIEDSILEQPRNFSAEVVENYVGSPLVEPVRVLEYLSTNKTPLSIVSTGRVRACNEIHETTSSGSAFQCKHSNNKSLSSRELASHLGNLPHLNMQKVSSLGKSREEQNIPSSHSPQTLSSRRSNKPSFIGEYDDEMLPFAITEGVHTRTENYGGKELANKKLASGGTQAICISKNSAIGTLTEQLSAAPPLDRHPSESTTKFHRTITKRCDDQRIKPEENAMSGTVSSIFSGKILIPRTLADALAELKDYRNVNSLSRQSDGLMEDSNEHHNPEL